MEAIKTWLVEVLFKNVGPKVVASLMASAVAFILAHQQLMEKMGITYYPDFKGIWSGVQPTGSLIVIEMATLQIWGGAALVAGFVAVWAIIQHHGVATVKGTPQTGDMRKINLPVIGGERKEDIKTEEPSK